MGQCQMTPWPGMRKWPSSWMIRQGQAVGSRLGCKGSSGRAGLVEERKRCMRGCPASECQGKPLPLKWVDVNKGDHTAPKIRSRLVAKEIKRAKPLAEQLGADTFAATPPLESVYALMSAFMTRRERGEVRKMMAAWDVSRAHFMGKAAREIFVELPEEDKHQPEDEVPMVGRLLRSMYGTQDASQIFQKDYQCWFEKPGCTVQCTVPSSFPGEEHDGFGAW